MVMLITKFHRLIGNKLFWIAFSTLVVIAFGFWTTQQQGGQSDARSFASPWTLNGKEVPREEFQWAKNSTYLSLVLQARSPIPRSNDLESRLADPAWRRLITLRLARDLGVIPGDNEVAANLAAQPLFSPNGTFDKSLYQRFVTQELPLLTQFRLSLNQFESHVRDEMSIDKLARMISETILVSPLEVRRMYERLNETFDVEFTIIRPEDVEDQVSLSEDDVRAFFDQDPAAFELSERVAVKYVTIKAADHTDKVSVDDSSIEAYYEANREQYAVIDTNALGTLLGDTNDFSASLDTNTASATDDEGAYQPLEEVRDEIHATLQTEAARLEAVKIANDLVYTLTPDRYGSAPGFDETAEKLGLQILSLDPFAEDEPVAAFDDVDAELRAQAFMLFPNPDEHFSNPVAGTNAVYVLALVERIPPRVPDFAEVAADVEPIARAAAIGDAMRSTAEGLKEAFEGTADGEAVFSDVVARAGLVSTNSGPFSMVTGLEDFPSSTALRLSMSAMNEGEVSEPIEIQEGYLVGHLKTFTPADPSNFAAVKQQFGDRLRSQYLSMLFVDWQNQLLDDAEFTEQTYEDQASEEDAADSAPADTTPADPADAG